MLSYDVLSVSLWDVLSLVSLPIGDQMILVFSLLAGDNRAECGGRASCNCGGEVSAGIAKKCEKSLTPEWISLKWEP